MGASGEAQPAPYTLTPEGREECDRLKLGLEPFLDSIIDSITLIKKEIYG